MVTAMFRDRINAERAFDWLHAHGYPDSEINVLMSDKTRATYYAQPEEGKILSTTKVEKGMGIGGAIGTITGAALAAVAMIGASIAVPGLGGLIIAGPLAGALVGGGAGAVAGGIIGALVGWGIPEDNARAYQEALRGGGVILGVVPRDGEDAAKIQEEFKNLHGEDICYV
jgi:hypothetical protein